MSALARKLRAFRDDEPGQRFGNHFARMQRGSRIGAIARIALGALVILVGLALLVLPGPGVLVALVGIGLIAGESRRVAGLLDRAEPRVRQRLRRIRAWFQRLRQRLR